MTYDGGSTSTPDVFAQFGFTPAEADGFRTLWESPHVVFLLDFVAEQVREAGGTADQAIDYVMHGVEPEDVAFLITMDFTGHQAGLISQSKEATRKLQTTTWKTIGSTPIKVPRAYLVDLLRSPMPPPEADDLIDRYREVVAGNPRTVDGVVDSTEHLAGTAALLAMDQPSQDCTCR